ncbi:MAG: hypothetical protein H6581_09435 [Bacteroidia bacterium]|nr:hypothetical protein [Bacteroidia bacterium]
MKRALAVGIVLMLAARIGCSQNPVSNLDLGIEFQAYPTGLIPGLRADLGIGDRNSFDLRLGLQLIDHQDFGVHENETGSGFGFSLGYRRFLQKKVQKGLFVGLRNDFWFNAIDWQDGIGTAGAQSGRSRIMVVQPTVRLGWLFILAQEKLALAPAVSFGYEINVITHGEPVGQGSILLAGLTAVWRISKK